MTESAYANIGLVKAGYTKVTPGMLAVILKYRLTINK